MKKNLWLLLPVAAFLVFPFLVKGYVVGIVVVAGVFALTVIGLDLILGYGGQLALGHTGFMALGAYSSALLTTKLGVSPWLALALGVLGTSLVAYLVGIATLRLRGIYFGMA